MWMQRVREDERQKGNLNKRTGALLCNGEQWEGGEDCVEASEATTTNKKEGRRYLWDLAQRRRNRPEIKEGGE